MVSLIHKPNHTLTTFISSAIETLKINPIQNNLLCGVLLDYQKNLQSLQSLQKENPVFIEIIDETSHLSFYFFQPRPECALISAGSEALIEFFVSEIFKMDLKIQSIIGPTSTLTHLQKHWQNKNLPPLKILMQQNVMAADTIQLPASIEGKMIRAEQSHFAFLLESTKAFYQETNPKLKVSEEHLRLRIQLALDQQEYFIWSHQSENLAYIQIGRPVFENISILGLYVKPDYRLKKIGANLMAHTCQNLLNNYRACTLFTDQSVAHTNALYQKLGFKVYDQFQHCCF